MRDCSIAFHKTSESEIINPFYSEIITNKVNITLLCANVNEVARSLQ